MNPSQDLVTPEVPPKASTKNAFATPQSVMDELHYSNKKPLSSGKSPRQEELIRRKQASETRFRNVVDSIQMANDATSFQDTSSIAASKDISSKAASKDTERRRNKDKKSKSSSKRARRSKSPSRRKRESVARKAYDKKDSPDSDTWGIKSVVSDNMDSWMHFDDSEAEFSESNHGSRHDTTSMMSSEVGFLMQTPVSTMERSTLGNSLNASQRTDFTSKQSTPTTRHPTLQNLVVMDSGKTRSQPPRSPSSRHRKRKKKSSRDTSDSNRQLSVPSTHSSHSMNPTPSVIADGVQQVAAKFDVDMSQASPTSSQERLSVSAFLNDDTSLELRRKAAYRSASRRSKVPSRRRMRFNPEGIELLTDEDQETMSTISYDPVLDVMAATRNNTDATDDGANSSEELQPSATLSDEDRQRLIIEAIKMKRASHLADRQKAQSLRSLPDVLELSREGEMTEDESLTKNSAKPSPSKTKYTTHDVKATVLNDDSVELKPADMEGGLVSGFDDWEVDVANSVTTEVRRKTWKDVCCIMAKSRNLLACAAIFLVILVVVVAVLLGLRVGQGTSPPAVAPSGNTPSPGPAYSNEEVFAIISEASPADESVLLSNDTPQGKAVDWMNGPEDNILSDRNRILQRFALATFYFATLGEGWAQNNGWLSSDNECTWFSSTSTPCDDDGNVVSLSLGFNKLIGELPEEVGLLSTLRSIELPGNSLFGSLPSLLQDLQSLNRLNLDSNSFDRGFPEIVTNLTNLIVLSLNLNQITGSLPNSLSKLTKLEVLSAAANQLSADLPAGISELKELRELNLEFNDLSGSIRSELGLLAKLEYLKLGVNLFSREIPTELGLLVNLRSFSCNDCSLFGSIPTQIGLLVRLETLELQSNQLTGTIPGEIGWATNLRLVDLSSNLLAGTLASDLGRLVYLSTFDVSNNRLTGTIPKELASIRTNGFVLHLDGDQFSGSIPSELCAVLVANSGLLSIDESSPVQLCDCVDCHSSTNTTTATRRLVHLGNRIASQDSK